MRSNLTEQYVLVLNRLSFAPFHAALALLVHELQRAKLDMVEIARKKTGAFCFDDLFVFVFLANSFGQ